MNQQVIPKSHPKPHAFPSPWDGMESPGKRQRPDLASELVLTSMLQKDAGPQPEAKWAVPFTRSFVAPSSCRLS